MARATEDRISRALRLLSAVEREDRRRAAARRRRHGGLLYAASLAALGALAAAPGVLASVPNDLARQAVGGLGVLAKRLGGSTGFAESGIGADATPSTGPAGRASGSRASGLRIILDAPPRPSAPCDPTPCPSGGPP